MPLSSQRQREILEALRRGTVPRRGLEAFAVGLERFGPAFQDDLAFVGRGGSVFKALRGEYGSGKTFLARWLQDQAQRVGFVTAEVQVSETETPLHRLETVYRRMMERLSTDDVPQGAFRSIVERWFYVLEQDVLTGGTIASDDAEALRQRSAELLEARLQPLSQVAPTFAAALRGYRQAQTHGDRATADALLAWVSGQPNVGAQAKRASGLKGEVDHFAALGFIHGLLLVLRDAGHTGLVVVLDEVETLQRVRRDVREKALNALRQWIDEIDGGRFPGLYLAITGTPAFFEGSQGVALLPPLSQRLATHFDADPRFDNPRAPQVRLQNFDLESLVAVATRVRAIYVEGNPNAERILARVDDGYVDTLARVVVGKLGGRVGVAPRLFLKKLVADILDRVDLYADFDPRRDYRLTLEEGELNRVERNATAVERPDDIELDL